MDGLNDLFSDEQCGVAGSVLDAFSTFSRGISKITDMNRIHSIQVLIFKKYSWLSPA
jgi:hypothetical protein